MLMSLGEPRAAGGSQAPSQAMLGEVVPRILHIWGGDAWMMMCVGGEASVYRG